MDSIQHYTIQYINIGDSISGRATPTAASRNQVLNRELLTAKTLFYLQGK